MPPAAAALQSPAALRMFQAAARSLTRWAGLLLPLSDWETDQWWAAQAPCPQHCYALIVSTHLVFGLYLPTAAVYVRERRARSEFLAKAALEAGAAGARQAAEQLRVPLSEILHLWTFDPVAAWQVIFTLLLPLATLAWLLVLLLCLAYPSRLSEQQQ